MLVFNDGLCPALCQLHPARSPVCWSMCLTMLARRPRRSTTCRTALALHDSCPHGYHNNLANDALATWALAWMRPGTCDIGGWKPPILVFLPAKAALCLEMRSWGSAPLAIAPCDRVRALAPEGMLALAGDPLRPSGGATRGAAAREPPAVGDGMRQMQGEQGAAAAPRP